jgi:hypothetical protein
MAALAGMTVVVEAAARSGSLITADLAADPGPVNSAPPPGPITCSPAAPASSATPRTSSTPCSSRARRLDHAGSALEWTLATAVAAVESGHSTCARSLPSLTSAARRPPAAFARLELLGYLTCSTVGA